MPISAANYSYSDFVVNGEGILPVVENGVFTHYQESQATRMNLLYKPGYYGCFFPCQPGDIVTVINGGCNAGLIQTDGHNNYLNSVFFIDPRLQTLISHNNADYGDWFRNKELVIPEGAGFCAVNSSHGHVKVFKGKFLHVTVKNAILTAYEKYMNVGDTNSLIPTVMITFDS